MSYQNKGTTTATAIVSLDPDRSGNFVSFGAEDDVEINAAIIYVYAMGGGKVVILYGVYDITSPIQIPACVVVEGQNKGITTLNTILLLANNSDCNIIEFVQLLGGGQDFFGEIKNITINGNGTNQAGTSNGISIAAFHSDITIFNIFITNCLDAGISITHVDVYYTNIYHNWIESNSGPGISKVVGAGNTQLTFIANNILTLNQYGIYFDRGGSDIISNNWISNNDLNGIYIKSTGFGVIDGNIIKLNGQNAANTSDEIYIWSANNIIIDGNNIGNIQARYAIYITFGTAITLGTNHLITGATGFYHEDNSTVSKPTKSFQFIQGTTFISADGSAKGWEINAEADMAIALGQLPIDLHQVVRIKIWAVALGAPAGAGGQMHLDILFNAGGSLEAYNLAANSWTLANFNGEEADYVNTNVIHWVVEDSDVGNEISNLLAGDSLELKVNGGTAVAPDGATNATFRAIEIEYV